jgi:negative regulator of replication initiation
MKTIQIEDEVFAVLESRVRGFSDTPNEVIKRLLESSAADDSSLTKPKSDKISSSNNSSKISAIVHLVQSPEYLMGDAKGRYFAVLEFLYHQQKDKFSVLEQYGRGKRIIFARDAKTIEESGNSTFPQRIPNTPYYAVTNLPNSRKRKILEGALGIFHYPSAEIGLVLKSIPDSGISRPKHENIFAGFTL